MIDLQAGEAWRVPPSPGVYVLWRGGKPFYVGKTLNLQQRFRQHASRSHNLAVRNATRDGLGFTYELAFTEAEVDSLERHLIRDLNPPANISGTKQKKDF